MSKYESITIFKPETICLNLSITILQKQKKTIIIRVMHKYMYKLFLIKPESVNIGFSINMNIYFWIMSVT